MFKKSYTVNESNQRQDNSFKICLCMILQFIALCLVIILVGNWKLFFGSNNEDKTDNEKLSGNEEILILSEQLSSNRSEKLINNSTNNIATNLYPITSSTYSTAEQSTIKDNLNPLTTHINQFTTIPYKITHATTEVTNANQLTENIHNIENLTDTSSKEDFDNVTDEDDISKSTTEFEVTNQLTENIHKIENLTDSSSEEDFANVTSENDISKSTTEFEVTNELTENIHKLENLTDTASKQHFATETAGNDITKSTTEFEVTNQLTENIHKIENLTDSSSKEDFANLTDEDGINKSTTEFEVTNELNENIHKLEFDISSTQDFIIKTNEDDKTISTTELNLLLTDVTKQNEILDEDEEFYEQNHNINRQKFSDDMRSEENDFLTSTITNSMKTTIIDEFIQKLENRIDISSTHDFIITTNEDDKTISTTELNLLLTDVTKQNEILDEDEEFYEQNHNINRQNFSDDMRSEENDFLSSTITNSMKTTIIDEFTIESTKFANNNHDYDYQEAKSTSLADITSETTATSDSTSNLNKEFHSTTDISTTSNNKEQTSHYLDDFETITFSNDLTTLQENNLVYDDLDAFETPENVLNKDYETTSEQSTDGNSIQSIIIESTTSDAIPINSDKQWTDLPEKYLPETDTSISLVKVTEKLNSEHLDPEITELSTEIDQEFASTTSLNDYSTLKNYIYRHQRVSENLSETPLNSVKEIEETSPTIVPETLHEAVTEALEAIGNVSGGGGGGRRWNADKSTTMMFRKSTPVCHTYECKSVASRMLSLMNDLIDACEDFYAYSCGGGMLFEDNADSDPWSIHLKQITRIKTNVPYIIKYKAFYQSCIRFFYDFDYRKRIEQVKLILDDILLVYETKDLTDILIIMLKTKSNHFLDIDVGIDKVTLKPILELKVSTETSTSTTTNVVNSWSALLANHRRCLSEQRYKIYEPNLNMTKLHESYIECQNDRTANINYRNLLANAFNAFDIPHEQFKCDFTDYLKIYPTQEEILLDTINQRYENWNLNELQANIPYIDWRKLLKTITKQQIDNETDIRVYFAQYFKEFANLKLQKELLINELIGDLYYNYVIAHANDVEKDCIQLTVQNFKDIASFLYLQHFDAKLIEKHEMRAKEIFIQLKKAMSLNLQRQFHNDLIFEKQLTRLKMIFSSAKHLPNENDLNHKYLRLNVNDDDYFMNIFNIKQLQFEWLLQTKPHGFGSLMDSFAEKPVTFYETNIIYIINDEIEAFLSNNNKILDVPFGYVVKVDFNLPNSIILARIGFDIAKAIGKHFNSIGINYPINNPIKKYFYDNIITKSNDLFPVIESKYQFELTFNYDLSVNDRISDNIAMRMVSEVYENLDGNDTRLPWFEDTLTKENIFYVAIAQGFCERIETPLDSMLRIFENDLLPNSIRLENILQNSEAFANSFECASGSGMNNLPRRTQFPNIDDDSNEYNEYDVN